jgi:hypothetical protein
MDFPRFTSGNVGALSFAHVNAIFERIERLEASLGKAGKGRAGGDAGARGRVITVRVTGVNTEGRVAWQEVERVDADVVGASSNVWQAVESGTTSKIGDNNFAVPLLGGSAQVDAIVYGFLRSDSQGHQYIEAVQPRLPGFFQIITFSGGAPRWTYVAYPAQHAGGTIGWIPTPMPGGVSPDPVTMYNTCEDPDDDALTVGVGTVKPNGVTMVRQPIKSGTTVFAAPDVNGVYCFSVPNGYQVTCS